jgi:HD-GYP domain-containing protein (c-di-GMP phosphodiesterase class II)
MRQVPIEQLRTGDRLGRNVHGGSEHLVLLCAGVRVSDSYRQSLRRAGITSVWIDDGLSEGIEPEEVLGEATKQRATAAIRTAFRDVTESLATGGRVSSGAVQEMHDVAEMIVSDVSRSVHSALALNDLANSDGYTLKHSLAVTTLGLSLGVRVMQKYGWVDAHGKRRYDGIDDRLAVLGVGLLLHDIGKLAVPPDILRKPGKLTEDEWKAMRAHPMLGIQILKSADGISPLARAVVRSHHERWNGGGYPDGMSGAEIHQFARIAAVADVFDALTSDRAYRQALPTPEVYDYISTKSGQEFDPEVVSVFRSFVAPYPVGTTVLLSDGTTGIVKEVKPDVVTRPIVRVIADPHGAMIAPREIDLSLAPGIQVVSTNLELPVPVVA